MTPTKREILAAALREVVERRMRALPVAEPLVVHNQVDLPVAEPPVVNVDVQAPNVDVRAPQVVVDMRPVADAIDRMSAAIISALDNRDELLSQLLQVLAESPPPNVTIKPRIMVERPQAAPPAPAPAPAPQEKRSLVITHSDGTKTKVEEQ